MEGVLPAGTVCGIPLPPGLVEATSCPSDLYAVHQAQSGHDENISFERVAELLGEATARRLRDLTLAIYGRPPITPPPAAHHRRHEFEFAGWRYAGAGDEVAHARFSRFWRPRLASADPAFVRQAVCARLPGVHPLEQAAAARRCREVAQRTSEKYQQAYRAITGKAW